MTACHGDSGTTQHVDHESPTYRIERPETTDFSVAERESIAATRASQRPMRPCVSPPVSPKWWRMAG